jgi:hypothetical protein
VVLVGDRGTPTGLDDDGLMRLDDDCGSIDVMAGRNLIAHKYVRIVPAAA